MSTSYKTPQPGDRITCVEVRYTHYQSSDNKPRIVVSTYEFTKRTAKSFVLNRIDDGYKHRKLLQELPHVSNVGGHGVSYLAIEAWVHEDDKDTAIKELLLAIEAKAEANRTQAIDIHESIATFINNYKN